MLQRRAQQSHRIAILRFAIDPKDRLESTHVRKKKAKHDSVGGIHLALFGSSSWNRGGKKRKKKMETQEMIEKQGFSVRGSWE